MYMTLAVTLDSDAHLLGGEDMVGSINPCTVDPTTFKHPFTPHFNVDLTCSCQVYVLSA